MTEPKTKLTIAEFVQFRYEDRHVVVTDTWAWQTGAYEWSNEARQLLDIWNPAREVSVCDAALRAVARHRKCGTGSGYCDDGGHGWDADDPGCADLADLALPYADHPDYRQEWRP